MLRPAWLVVPAPNQDDLAQMQSMLNAGNLHTVCESANCPNIGECFSQKTCTFMILGNICTRNCRFCAVEHGQLPLPVDREEPKAVALSAKQLNLAYVVVTSVTRDDLPDGGAGHFAKTIQEIRQELPSAKVEVLIPDLLGQFASLRQIIDAGPEVISHNIETVPRLYKDVRPQAIYERSLQLLKRVSTSGKNIAKAGIMLGLGEGHDEVLQTMVDIKAAGCQFLTIGQYLRPSAQHHPIMEYIHPTAFKMWEEKAYEIGFSQVVSGPMVRSSYHAGQCYAKTFRS
ncbi:lipoyl synthase [Pelosinus fermentans]|uniref:lipoyl synthase n=1 Tax=Pelosinus fermentans TaxID=365349 RepID=UPI00026861F0|nr:lipoyl synthase [Pelosinus fermentans]EIW26138.1 Lipoyl synthase [Pelosinus fermentans A11]